MSDLRERLRVLDRLEPPDLRPRVGTHRVPAPPERRPARLIIGAAALAISVVAVGVLYAAFRGTAPPSSPSRPSVRAVPHPNGPIWFLGGNGRGTPGDLFGSTTKVYWVNPDGGTPHAVPTPKDLSSITAMAVSPDGRLVALSNGGGEFPPRNIYVMRSDGTELQKITSGNFFEVDPAWSPDGRSIVFASTRCCATAHSSGDYALFVINPDGSGLRQLTHDTSSDWAPAWSPDGSRIAYLAVPPNVSHPPAERLWQIWVVNADGSDAHPLTNDHRYDNAVTWSPDGTHLAYISHLVNNQDWQIRVMRTDGTDNHVVYTCTGTCKNGGYTLAWSPDGKQIAFSFSERIGMINADGSDFRVLDTHGLGACCPSWIPRSGS
jgi:Tol biopolymer transport system component